MSGLSRFDVGQSLPTCTRFMTRERMRWYCDALETTALANGEFVISGKTIHNDDEFAADNGLPGIIADGMISTNWISAMLYEAFGPHYLENGELKTKFIRPIYEDELVETSGRIEDGEDSGEGVTYVVQVWCQTGDEQMCTVGEARVFVPTSGLETA